MTGPAGFFASLSCRTIVGEIYSSSAQLGASNEKVFLYSRPDLFRILAGYGPGGPDRAIGRKAGSRGIR